MKTKLNFKESNQHDTIDDFSFGCPFIWVSFHLGVFSFGCLFIWATFHLGDYSFILRIATSYFGLWTGAWTGLRTDWSMDWHDCASFFQLGLGDWGRFFLGHTFDLVSDRSINYACAFKYHTPLQP